MSEGGKDDSFFWRTGAEPWVLENGRSGIGEWHGTQHEQLTNLAPGDYILEVNYRENGTRLDKFVIQQDTITPPTGEGPLQSAGLFPLPPKKPASLTAVALSDTEIEIKWTDYANDEDTYVIERKGTDTFTEIAQLAADTDRFIDTGLVAQEQYTYRVYAYNTYGRSNYSNADSALTLPASSNSRSKIHGNSITCYPNPFSTKTTFEISLNEPAKVTLSVYNITGQRVVNIEENALVSDKHTVEWQGTDSNGKRVPAGIYICSITYETTREYIPFIVQD
jgi:hypothetical protein